MYFVWHAIRMLNKDVEKTSTAPSKTWRESNVKGWNSYPLRSKVRLFEIKKRQLLK